MFCGVDGFLRKGVSEPVIGEEDTLELPACLLTLSAGGYKGVTVLSQF